MSVKIFLPTQLYNIKEDCEIFGEIQINECNGVSYFIVGSSSDNTELREFRHLGYIQQSRSNNELDRRDVALCFLYDKETPNLYVDKISIKPANSNQANIFLYNADRILKLQNVSIAERAARGHGDCTSERHGDIHILYRLLHQHRRSTMAQLQKQVMGTTFYLQSGLCWAMSAISTSFAALFNTRMAAVLLKRTVVSEHLEYWQKLPRCGRSRRYLNISLDRALGIAIMLSLLFITPEPGDYLIRASHFLIRHLQLLLGALKGNPIGLKLNEHLNNFFLDCFSYHIDLWARFLDLIEPLVRQLLLPIALIGPMGLSFQLALLSDLITVIGLHTHCLYIYAAVLYKVEIRGLVVLWKVVLGKRYNVLKSRVELHDYKNRQLFLATLFFTALLFLFPTILVYYIVFTTLRLCIYTVSLLLCLVQRCILNSPIELFYMWLTGNFYESESIQLVHETHELPALRQCEAVTVQLSVFRIKVHPAALGRIFQSTDDLTLKGRGTRNQTGLSPCVEICKRILAGTF